MPYNCPEYIRAECQFTSNKERGCYCTTCFKEPFSHHYEFCKHCPKELKEKYKEEFSSFFAVEEL